jgi:heme exporter protein B
VIDDGPLLTWRQTTNDMNWLEGAWAVFLKDLQLEWRSRFAINMLLLFVAASLMLIVFAVGTEPLSERILSGLLWIVILFSAAVGLGRTFISEEEKGTVLLLQLNTRATMVFAGKLLFNLVLMLAVNLLAIVVFVVILNMSVADAGLLGTALLLGAVGLSGAVTLLGAIIARAGGHGALLPVLMFPVLVPLLVSVTNATKAALPAGGGWTAAGESVVALVAFAGVTITASFLLFDYVWQD